VEAIEVPVAADLFVEVLLKMLKNSIYLFIWLLLFTSLGFTSEVSVTMDDPEITDSPLFTSEQRNDKILKALDRHKIKAALFVCGMRIDNVQGQKLLKNWDVKNHLIANHSYSHLYYPSKKISFEDYKNDFLKVEPLIAELKNFKKLYRYPYLKEGDTEEKRDKMRSFLKEHAYLQGYVTIDADYESA
jgi:hypothetical protein